MGKKKERVKKMVESLTLWDLIAAAHREGIEIQISFEKNQLVPDIYKAEGIIELTPPVVGSTPLYRGPTKAWGTDFELQTFRDGRVQVCLSGKPFLKFRPAWKKKR